ncbi:MAG: response regulator [Verrucomicrobia subdivision 3 bacterium]|nr:response regulator [Verrucomicrobiota bacterium]MCC6820578.1 response regulator [Limisphaerales bacterium]
MNDLQNFRVLIVEDDEEDFMLTRDLLKEIRGCTYAIEWARSFEEGLFAMAKNLQDICLVDFRLGAHDGVELLQAARTAGAEAPVILVTGAGHADADHAAMRAGAADYLVKGQIAAQTLERTIRYAIERKRAASLAAFEQARLAAFGAQVGLVLTCRAPLSVILENCAGAMAQYLNGALAQVWVYDAGEKALLLSASAGPKAAAALAASENLTLDALLGGQTVFVPDLAVDAGLGAPTWAQTEGLVSFAAYPLMLEGRLVGCMSLYGSEPLDETVLQELGSVANGVALCIQRKQAEEALDASENRYLSVVASIKEVVFQISEFGYWSFLNPAWTEITGFGVADTLGKSFLDFFHPDDRDPARGRFVKLVNGESDNSSFEARLLTRQGEPRWAELNLRLTRDEAGLVLGAAGSLSDITERKQAEVKVQKLAAFPRVNPNPVLEFTATAELSFTNDAAVELARSLGKGHILEILPTGVAGMVTDCLTRGVKRLREQVVINDRTISWSFFPVADSHVVHCYGNEITEMLSLETQYRHAQKLESVGQMAAGIAHDYNNVLTIIQGYADCLLVKVNGDESMANPLKQISGAARRATVLTRKLLTFSRKQVIQARPLSLNAVLADFGKMLPRLLGEDIVLKTNYADKLPSIKADDGMIEQVVMNLAVNARDAMPKGGCLTVATTATEIRADYVAHRPEARVGAFVTLTVQDTGCGMEAKTLARIFEPFFSTKEVGRGTGLGLATVYGIAKQHQGWVEVTSEVGKGTTFRVFFPALNVVAVETDDQNDSLLIARGGRETILLVEDEPLLRELVAKVLKEYDYRVLEAETGVEALRVWDASQGKVDLLLTDMVMPGGITGAELAQQLRKRKSDLRVIYSSGYSTEIGGKSLSENDPMFLAKPYRPPQLAQRVRKCLDNPPLPILELVTA